MDFYVVTTKAGGVPILVTNTRREADLVQLYHAVQGEQTRIDLVSGYDDARHSEYRRYLRDTINEMT